MKHFRFELAVFLFGLVGLCMSIMSGSTARAEIPAGKNVPTKHQYLERELAFDLKLTLGGYKARGLKNKKWDALAEKFIEQATERYVMQPLRPVPPDLLRQGHDLVQMKCKDGSVEYLYSWMMVEPDGKIRPDKLMRYGADKLKDRGFPPSLQAMAWANLATKRLETADDETVKFYREQIAGCIPGMFKDHTYAKSDRDIFCAHLERVVGNLTPEQLQAAWESVKDLPDADPVAVLLLEGKYHIAAGWKARGGGFADGVSKQGWEWFGKELAEARRCLTKAWELDKTIPEVPTVMITVEMGAGGKDAVRLWFDRAVAARFDHRRAYENYLFAMYPRWHGDRETLMAFAMECSDTRRFDTGVPLFMWNVLSAIKGECDAGDASAWKDPKLYARVREVFDRSTAPDGAWPADEYYRSMEAAFCVAAEHWDDARNVIEELKEPLNSNATFEMAQLPAATVRGMAYAFGGANNGAFKARALADAGNRRQAIDIYQAALRDQKDADAIQLLQNAIQVLQWELDFAAGKSVALKADSRLTGFANEGGQWRGDPDGGFTGTATALQYLHLVCPADFGDGWEVSAEIEFGNHRSDWDLAGFRIQTPGSSQYIDITLCRPLAESIPVKPAMLCVREIAGEPATEFPTDIKEGPNSLIVRRDGKTLIVEVNGKKLYTGAALADDNTHRLRIGFGGWPLRTDDSAHFKNVIVRQFHVGL